MDARDRDALVADRIRYLVADTGLKLNNEYTDRQYLLEDLCSRLLAVATHLDGRFTGPTLEDMVAVHHSYELAPREAFAADLAGAPVDPDVPLDDELSLAPPDRPCPYTFAHTRAFCGYSTCREH